MLSRPILNVKFWERRQKDLHALPVQTELKKMELFPINSW